MAPGAADMEPQTEERRTRVLAVTAAGKSLFQKAAS
jgi:hypothetical protein